MRGISKNKSKTKSRRRARPRRGLRRAVVRGGASARKRSKYGEYGTRAGIGAAGLGLGLWMGSRGKSAAPPTTTLAPTINPDDDEELTRLLLKKCGYARSAEEKRKCMDTIINYALPEFM